MLRQGQGSEFESLMSYASEKIAKLLGSIRFLINALHFGFKKHPQLKYCFKSTFLQENYCFDNITFVTKINSEEILSSYTNLFVIIIIIYHYNKYILEIQEKKLSVLQKYHK